MSSTPPLPNDSPPPVHQGDWRPSRRGLLLMALAFAVGLVLFALVWRTQSQHDFYRIEPVARPAADRAFDPLPAPLPANRDRAASGLGERSDRGDRDDRDDPRAARRDDDRAADPRYLPEPVAPPAPRPPPPPAAVAAADAPVAVHMPPPDYPRRALRDGVEGTVVVRADVGPDGVPTSVGIVRSSRSRDLDRAAVRAVERWRFRPAMADGRPTVGSVEIPIEFSARR